MDYQNNHVALALEIEKPKDPDRSFPEIVIREPCCWAAVFSVLAVLAVLFSIDELALCHAKFSIQSIAVFSSSPRRIGVDVYLLVKKPSFRCSIIYDLDYVSANLGPLKSALFNVSYNHRSDGHTDFLVVLAAETEVSRAANQNDVVSGVHDLNIKVLVKHEQFTSNNEPGHFNVHCPNITVVFSPGLKSGAMLGDEKIECHSSFLGLKELFVTPVFRYFCQTGKMVKAGMSLVEKQWEKLEGFSEGSWNQMRKSWKRLRESECRRKTKCFGGKLSLAGED